MKSQGFKDLIVYKKAFATAMIIFNETKKFPKEEMYSLPDQIRKSSHSVCVNIAEGYRKRQYQKHFVSKLSDSDGEYAETMVHLDFALECGYIKKDTHTLINDEYLQIGKMLGSMISSPEKFSVSAPPTATANLKTN